MSSMTHDSTTTEAHTERRGLSAVAKAARLVDIASHVDDSGADAAVISVRNAHLDGLPEAPLVNDVVEIQTDGAGFLALVEHMQLSIAPDDAEYDLAHASGYVGLLDLPVRVYTSRTAAVAAGLVIA